MTPVDDLVAWLTQVWDEQEREARNHWTWRDDVPYVPDFSVRGGMVSIGAAEHRMPFAEFQERYYRRLEPDPQVLARIAADRQILAEFVARDKDVDLMLGPDCLRQREWSGLRLALLLKAGQYKDRPGFNPDWRVDRPHP